MAAITAAEETNVSVTVMDAALPLATVARTGGGRCNLTNAGKEPAVMVAQYPRGGKFLLSVYSRFGPAETMDWFTGRGLPLTVEDHGRVFPVSGRASDVRELLAVQARSAGIAVRARAPVTGIRREGGLFRIPTQRGEEAFDRVILATGGDWRDAPDSGYALARSLGHTVTPLAPSLTGLRTSDPWTGSLAGLSLTEARLTTHSRGQKTADERGDLLFTHRGVSGPLAFKISSRCAFLGLGDGTPLLFHLSALPALRRDDWEKWLAASAGSRQQMGSLLRTRLPRAFAQLVLTTAAVDPTLVCPQCPREARGRLAALLDRFPLNVVDRETGEEMVTAGGVELSEIHPKTMESRLVPGLYFCGEVLDIDGFTGGFNLQAAWSTGYLAGRAASEKKE
jgi:predicted Rossmann fold flavoprotein